MEILYADKTGRATFRCPQCQFQRQFDASKYRETNSRITIRCRCGQTHDVRIEFRSFYRKTVQLYGVCTVHRLGATCPVLIDDVSLHGLRFVFMPEPGTVAPTLQMYEIVGLAFRLDNTALDWVRCRIEIRSVYDGKHGARIVSTGHEKELGFYLMQ